MMPAFSAKLTGFKCTQYASDILFPMNGEAGTAVQSMFLSFCLFLDGAYAWLGYYKLHLKLQFLMISTFLLIIFRLSRVFLLSTSMIKHALFMNYYIFHDLISCRVALGTIYPPP